MYHKFREELQICIDYNFTSQDPVFFALTIPFSYAQNSQYLKQLELSTNPEIYFRNEILVYSVNKLIVNLLTITQQEDYQVNALREDKIDNNLFPEDNRPFKILKPVIFISCRVHPGQVSASHTLKGILKFLLNPLDLRSYLLRKLFVFNIVPMVNPDGVFQGNYRMDTLGQNLNRYYHSPTFEQQPSVFAIKSVVDHLSTEDRMFMYFDMHAHTNSKSAFIYGNAFDNIVNQIQTQAFCRIFSINSSYFDYGACNFSEKHMAIKDKNEPLSKEGCSRVVFGKTANIIHALTLQTGIYLIQTQNKQIYPTANNEFTFNGKSITADPNCNKNLLMMYEQTGRNLLITILDVIEKNPFSRIKNSPFEHNQNIRKIIGHQIFAEEDRFKMLDYKAHQKSKIAGKLIKETFLEKLHKKWAYIAKDKEFMNAQWPVDGLKDFVKELERNQKMQRQGRKSPKKLKILPVPVFQQKLQTQITESNHGSKKKHGVSYSPSPWEKSKQGLENGLPKVIYQTTLKLDHSAIELNKISIQPKQKSSTRKLFRDLKLNKFQNYAIEGKPSLDQVDESISRIKINFFNALEQNEIFENKEKMQSKFQHRNSHLRNPNKNRLKTEQQSNINVALVIQSNKILNKQAYQECQTKPINLIDFVNQQEQQKTRRKQERENMNKILYLKSRSKQKRDQQSTNLNQKRKLQSQPSPTLKLPEIFKQSSKGSAVQSQLVQPIKKQLLIESIKLSSIAQQYSKYKL